MGIAGWSLLFLPGVARASGRPVRLEAAQRATQTVDDQPSSCGSVMEAPRGGCRGVPRRWPEQALVNELTAQAQFHIAGALEFLEDPTSSILGTGFHQRGGDDGQEPPFSMLQAAPGGALRQVQRLRTSTPPDRMRPEWRSDIVGAGQTGRWSRAAPPRLATPRDLSAFDGQFGDGGVVGGRTVEVEEMTSPLHHAFRIGARLLRVRAYVRLPARTGRRLCLHGPGQEYGLRKGDAVHGSIRAPREANVATSVRSSCRCDPSTPSTRGRRGSAASVRSSLRLTRCIAGTPGNGDRRTSSPAASSTSWRRSSEASVA